MPPTKRLLGLVGTMLAPFFALGRFLGVFGTSCCGCGRTWLFFSRLEALQAQFWRPRAPGRILGTPARHFASFFGAACMRSLDAPDAPKPQFLQCLPPLCVILRFLVSEPKNVIKVLRAPIQLNFSQKSNSMPVLGLVGLILDGPGALLGSYWTSVGRLLAGPGRLVASLGLVFGRLVALLKRSWVHFGVQRYLEPRFLGVLEPAGLGFEGFSALFCMLSGLGFMPCQNRNST